MNRETNLEVFNDTIRMIGTVPALGQALKHSLEGQTIIHEAEEVEDFADRNLFGAPAQLIVSRKRSFEAAAPYARNKAKVCVHNFASANNPGGGVTKGSSAQEEALCRISTLYSCINDQSCWDGFYKPHRNSKNPLHNDDCIYTPGVMVFKGDNWIMQRLKPDDWYMVDVITCAAPNLRENPSNSFNPGDGIQRAKISLSDLSALHMKRLKRMLDIACAKHVEVMILGAFGCGVFKNPPDVVAHAYKKVLKDYRNNFKTIEFAIAVSSGNDTNHRVFNRIIANVMR